MAVSTTLATLYQRTADELGPHYTMAVSTVATGPDPARYLLNNVSLIGQGQAPRYRDYFVAITSGVLQYLRVAEDYPQMGALMLDGQLGSGAAAIGVTFELSWPLPLFTTGAIPGIADKMILQACRDVYYEDTIDLTPSAGDYTVDLSYGWLVSEDLILRDPQGRPLFYDPPITTGYPQRQASWRYGELNFQAGVPSIRLTQAYGDSLDSSAPAQLAVLRPAYSLVNGLEHVTGPLVAANTISADPTEIVEVAKLKAYEYLATASHVTGEERQRYAGLVEPQRAYVRSVVRHYRPQQAPQAAGRAA